MSFTALEMLNVVGPAPDPRGGDLFSSRRLVLRYSWKGFGVKETAALMGLSAKTVKNYRQDIFLKFDVRNVESMLRVGVERGYIDVKNREEQDWP